jgi:rifampicin phosphotransferase
LAEIFTVAVAPDDGLPRPPGWRVSRDHFVALDVAARTALLRSLEDGRDGYWVLHQGAMAAGSQRQLLANLDSAVSLQAALTQHFSQPAGAASLLIQRLPPQHSAGVLFSQHPRRPDLDHVVVEFSAEEGTIGRLILHADGQLAWCSDPDSVPALLVSALADLAIQLKQTNDLPSAAEWVWDGSSLWVIQVLSIGSLPVPGDAWTRHSAAIGVQVISPLWYTLFGRWLKAGFWRPLGLRAGWRELSNIEPFRRQHSHLYLNSQFIVALQKWRGRARLDADLPPAWRRRDLPAAAPVSLLGRLRFRLRLAMLQRRLQRWPDSSDTDMWLQLMALDKLGEQFADLHGLLQMIWLPEQAGFLSGLSARQCQLLIALADSKAQAELLAEQFANLAPGNDPVWPRWSESPADMHGLLALWQQLPQDRRERIAGLKAEDSPLAGLRAELDAAHGQLGSMLRRLLGSMAQQLHAKGRLNHPDDVYFLYFDELWQCWRGQQRPGLASKVAERKVRYLTDGHSGPPDWVIDQIGYGTSAFAQENRQPLLRGYALMSGKVSGPVRRLASGWQLNQVCPGDILVLDQSDSGWLPWLSLAGALVLTHRDPHDPAVALARQLQIPAIWGVDDAMHCVVDGDVMEIDGDQGTIV